MASPILGISIPASLEGKQFDKNYTPSTETLERVKELGLETLLNEEDSAKMLETLEKNIWKKSPHIHEKQLKYKITDFKTSLNFLEIFCLYAAQLNYLTQKNKKPLSERMDKTVIKAIKEIEYLNKLLETDIKEVKKGILKQRVEKLNYLINKIFTENLGQTEQIAMAKIVEKAQRVVQKLGALQIRVTLGAKAFYF